MKIHQDINRPLGIRNPVVTTGTFDGVHIGHRQILQRINEVAKTVGGESVLFSFFPHPRMVLYPDDHGLKLLHTQSEKHAALEKAGIDHLIEVPFTLDFAGQSAKEYVNRILVESIQVHTMVIGYDHRFGRSREGDINTLKVLGLEFGFEVEEIPAHMIRELKVSSTKIRTAIAAGNVEMATLALGRPYSLSGLVVEGEKIGRTLGFPTANLEIVNEFKLIPANGVYAVRVYVKDDAFLGMMNIGYRPTINQSIKKRSIEVHVLDFDSNVYGEMMNVELVSQIREEVRFESLDLLKAQLLNDKKAVENFFE